jgi:hypothetical protein
MALRKRTQPEPVEADSIEHMTRAELRALIEDILREHQTRPTSYTVVPDRPLKVILAEMRANRWTPPPDAKSPLEMLREDRDR